MSENKLTVTNQQVYEAMIKMLKRNLVRERWQLNESEKDLVKAYVDLVVAVNEDHDYYRNTLGGGNLRQITLIECLAKMFSPQYVALHADTDYRNYLVTHNVIVRENDQDLLPGYGITDKMRMAHQLSELMKNIVVGCRDQKEHSIREMRECMDYADKRNEFVFASTTGDMYSDSTKYNFAGIPVVVSEHPKPEFFLNSNIEMQLFKYIDSMPEMCDRGDHDDYSQDYESSRHGSRPKTGGSRNKTKINKKVKNQGQTDED